jgi:hypothetical protein
MPIITVVKQFMLKDENNHLTEYLVGKYDVADEIATHWYVQAHCEGFVEPPPKTGTDQQAVLLATQAARLSEAVAETAQPKAEPPAGTKKQNRFAGNTRPVAKNDPTPSFINPADR